MWKLTHKGKYITIYGSPEYRVYQMIHPVHGLNYEVILQELGKVGKRGYEFCLRNGYLEYNTETKKIYRKRLLGKDIIKIYLNEIDNGFILSKTIMNLLKKRDLIENL